MSRSSAIALVVADPDVGRLGHRRALTDTIAGRPVLELTLARACRIAGVSRVVVLHPPGRDPLAELPADARQRLGLATSAAGNGQAPPRDARGSGHGPAVVSMAHDQVAGDAHTPRRRSARRWALTAWRGGLGGATAWDELLPAAPLAAALDHHHADAAVLLGGDWCLADPAYATALLELHRSAPDAMKLTFTQAPPGLGPLVLGRGVVQDLARHHASVGGILAYNPRRPAVDPVGREVNHPIPATVRDTARRFVYDTPAGRGLLHALADHLGPELADADADAVTDACRAIERQDPGRVFDTLPPQIVIELTPRRHADGPILPQHHADPGRGDMDTALAIDLVQQCAGHAVTLGGIGDATLHPDWAQVAEAALSSGVEGLQVETDLLAERDALGPLVRAFAGRRIDVVGVRLPADTAETYRRVMGVDRFAQVMDNLQWLFDQRSADAGAQGLPWIVPRFTKTRDNLADMESFFERWTHLVQHAVIDRFPTGGTGSFALAPDLNPVPMDPPWKPPSPHQVKRRLTVLADGRVTLCQQDWQGRAALGHLADAPLRELWRRAQQLPPPGSVDDAPVCRRCRDWWSLHSDATASAVV